jgi:hypothetical protein
VICVQLATSASERSLPTTATGQKRPFIEFFFIGYSLPIDKRASMA